MKLEYACPPQGQQLQDIRQFLAELSLDWDTAIEKTVVLTDDDKIIATGSIRHNVLQCIGVDPSRRGEGLASVVVSELIKVAEADDKHHLFLFTKPGNEPIFTKLGFHRVARTGDVLLLENTPNGIQNYVAGLEQPRHDGLIAGIVMNCNPFTNGHLYLISTAAAACDLVHIFVVSEDRSFFPADVRYRLVQENTAHLPNVVVHPTSDYLISSATFPDYFLKDKTKATQMNCELDLTIFARCFAEPLGITRRYVGREPFCPTTSEYNRQMNDFLPNQGVEVIEIDRCEIGGSAVSASRVRRLLDEGDITELRPLVPAPTFAHLETLLAQTGASVA